MHVRELLLLVLFARHVLIPYLAGRFHSAQPSDKPCLALFATSSRLAIRQSFHATKSQLQHNQVQLLCLHFVPTSGSCTHCKLCAHVQTGRCHNCCTWYRCICSLGQVSLYESSLGLVVLVHLQLGTHEQNDAKL